MFFVLSKVLLLLIQPSCWIFYLLVVAFIVKKAKLKKRLFIAATALLYIFSNNVLLTLFQRAWDIGTTPLKPGAYSCAIVLGGFSGPDSHGKGYYTGAANRYITGVDLYETGKAKKILISGGSGLLLQGSDFKEADFAASELKLLHIPDSAIMVEDQSRNTWENADFSKKVLLKNKVPGPYLLVTSAFHMRRALYTFKKIGLDVVPYSSEPAGDNKGFSLFDMLVPDPNSLATWNGYTKEIVGYITYSIKPYH